MTAWWLLAASLAVIVWLLFRQSRSNVAGEHTFELRLEQERVLTAQKFYLETLRRELAQLIMGMGLETFERAFYKMCEFEREMSEADSERRGVEKALLLQKYPNLENFDLIGTRHFVSYDGVTRDNDIEDLVERYKDISRFLALLRFEKKPTDLPVYGEEEVNVFGRQNQAAKDKRLRHELEEAMKRFYIHARAVSNVEKARNEHEYEDGEFRVVSLLHVPGRKFTPEVQYGIYSKKLNEYGLFSFFVHDEEGSPSKTYEHYDRSDSSFSEELPLHD